MAAQLNTPRLITDSDGNTVWKWDGEAFGNTPPTAETTGSGSFVFNLRFPGQYYDAETGLNQNNFRDYDPSTGRYVESDPIGLKGGISTFGYVEGNPLSSIDPLGLAKSGWANSPMDPNSQGCINILKRIENLKEAIQRQIDNMAANEQLLNLPYYAPGFDGPGGAWRDSVWGHEQQLAQYRDDLQKRIKKYEDRCKPPPAPVTSCPPNNKIIINNIPQIDPLKFPEFVF